MGLLPTARRRARVSDPVPVASTSQRNTSSSKPQSSSTTGKRRLCPGNRSTDNDIIRVGVASRKRRRAPSPCPDVVTRPRKRQKAPPFVFTDSDVIEIPSSPSPPPRPIRPKGRTVPEVISLISDSESDDHAPLDLDKTPLHHDIDIPFSKEDEELVSAQLAPSTPSTTISTPISSRVAHASPSAIEECLRDGHKTITSVLHLLPPELLKALPPSPPLVPHQQSSAPSDAPIGSPDPLKRTPSPPNGPLETPDRSPPEAHPRADNITPPSSPPRKRRRSNKLATNPITSQVLWTRQKAVDYMGCHHSLWSPRLVREEVTAVASISQQEVKGGGKDEDGEEELEEEDEEIDQLISSDTEEAGKKANDTTRHSPPLPVVIPEAINHLPTPSTPSSPSKSRQKSLFSPSLFVRVLNLQRSSKSTTPPSLLSLPSPLSSVFSTTPTPTTPMLKHFDNPPPLVDTISDVSMSPIPNVSMDFSWTMEDPDPVDDIEDADFANMVLTYPS